jgi:ribosomal protein S18 acetylase RimI-like enzyme
MAFTFCKGISMDQINQLVNLSNDVTDLSVSKFTSDNIRFSDKKSFDKWFQKGRTIYTVTDGENLVGIIWFGKKKIPLTSYSHNITFAIRIYPKARGKGLSSKFMDYALKSYKPSKTWLECSADNISAVKLYSKFGFKKITSPDSKNKIIMILN